MFLKASKRPSEATIPDLVDMYRSPEGSRCKDFEGGENVVDPHAVHLLQYDSEIHHGFKTKQSFWRQGDRPEVGGAVG